MYTSIELGTLYFERGDTLKSISLLEPVVAQCLEEKKKTALIECVSVLFRCYVELKDFDKIDALKEQILLPERNLVEKSLQPKIYYHLALCESARRNYDLSYEYCQTSLKLSLDLQLRDDVAHAILGTAIVLYYKGQYGEALKEIYNLQVFMGAYDVPKITVSTHILKGNILRKLKRFDQAIEVLWQAYDLLKRDKNLLAYISTLYSLGCAFKEFGRLKEARNYLDLARRSTDSKNLLRLHDSIEEALLDFTPGSTTKIYDLVFDREQRTVQEKQLGPIEFKNKFLLLELLSVFTECPGEIFKKEELVRRVWKQNYSPAIHDNKIYVNIKRLRTMIEPNFNRPKYIFRSKEGYY